MAQESLEYGQITIGDFAEILKKIVQYGYGKEVISLDCGSIPTRFASWRGAYRCLTISHEECYPEECTVSALLEKAEKAKNGIFYGYKGGRYQMSSRTPLFADPYYNASGRYVIGIKKRDRQWIILTEHGENEKVLLESRELIPAV